MTDITHLTRIAPLEVEFTLRAFGQYDIPLVLDQGKNGPKRPCESVKTILDDLEARLEKKGFSLMLRWPECGLPKPPAADADDFDPRRLNIYIRKSGDTHRISRHALIG